MKSSLPPEISRLFQWLRRKIRYYIFAETWCTCLFYWGIFLWITYFLDRFLELPRWVRCGCFNTLLLIGTLAYLASRLRLLFRTIPDHTLAVLLERRFPQLNDALLTLTEPEKRDAENAERLAKIEHKVVQQLKTLPIWHVFRFRPLLRVALGVVLVSSSIFLYCYHYPQQFQVWQERFTMGNDTPWPRQVYIEMDSAFANGTMKIARGSDVCIRLRAGVNSPKRQLNEVLRTVYFMYRTEDGIRDRIPMERENKTVNEAGADCADFSYTFRGVLKSFDFDIKAGDATARNLRIEVVDSPAMTLTLRLDYPKYTALTPKTLRTGAIQAVPPGTTLTLHGQANKPLTYVNIVRKKEDGNQKRETTQNVYPKPGDAQKITLPLGVFTDDETLLLTLHDTDGIQSPAPIKLVLAATEDALPVVAVNPSGIGDAITPNARIPMRGRITDDYGLKNVLFVWKTERTIPEIPEIPETPNIPANTDVTAQQKDAQPPRLTGFQTVAEWDGNGTATPLEFTLNGDETSTLDISTFGLREKDTFQLFMMAEDWNDLTPGAKRIGRSQPVTLQVVTPEQLRWKLEAREVVLSQLFDGVYDEIRDYRETLATLNFDWENSNSNHNDNQDADSPQALSSYRTERVIQNNRKNSYEFNGIAIGIAEVCQQMINNRIDTPAWSERLENGIHKPLLEVHEKVIPELETTLTELRVNINNGNATEAKKLHATASTQMDALLAKLLAVQEKMLKMQDFTEMVELLRIVVRQEEELQTELTKLNRSNLADFLSDDEDSEEDNDEDSEDSEDIQSENKPESAPSPQRLTMRQQEILRTFNLWDEKVPQMLEMLYNDAVHIELLREARRMSDEMRIRTRMETTIHRLEAESTSQASDLVKALIPDLKKILRCLETEDRNQRIQTEAERLRQHLKELNQRIREQQSLSGRTRQARDVAELAQEQDENARKTGELARKITDENEANETPKQAQSGTEESEESKESEKTDETEKQDANPDSSDTSEKSQSSDALRRAQERMDEARKKLENAERTEALDAQRQALQELEEARAELEQILRQLREEEAKRTLSQLETQLKMLLQLQRGIHNETQRLNGIPTEKRTREFTDETTRLSRREKDLALKADMLLTQLREDGRARMVMEVLSATTLDMQRVTDLLANGIADSVTLEVESAIIEAIEEMLAAVVESERKFEEEQNDNQNGADEAGEEQDPQLIDRIAELKMIRSAQVRIWRRTQSIGKGLSTETTQDPEQLKSLQDLARQQEKIRKILHEIAGENP